MARHCPLILVLLTKGSRYAVTMGFSRCHYPAYATRTRNSTGDNCLRRYAQSPGKAPRRRHEDKGAEDCRRNVRRTAGNPKGARIIDADESGKIEVLRSGTNGFTCMPGHGDTHPAMCADQTSTQWFEDAAAHRPK